MGNFDLSLLSFQQLVDLESQLHGGLRKEDYGPVKESNMERSERLLKKAIKWTESRILLKKVEEKLLSFSTASADELDSRRHTRLHTGLPRTSVDFTLDLRKLHTRFSQFHPESRTLRNHPKLAAEYWDCTSEIFFTMPRAILEKFDRTMKRAEENDKLREVLAGVLSSFRRCSFDIYAGYCLSAETWRLQSHIELVEDPAFASEVIDHALNMVVSAVIHLHLLCFVYQYLIGYVDRGGSKTYSSGSFDFRATYVAIVLFQGAHVWYWFRQATATPGSRKRKAASDTQPDTPGLQVGDAYDLVGIYIRTIKNKSGAITHYKYEPRFRPPREEDDQGTTARFNRLSLGEYNTPAEAKIVLQIARFYYEKDEGRVELEDGQYLYSIPPLSEQERGLSGEAKREWVARKAKQVGKQIYADFQKMKLLEIATTTGAHAGHGSDARSSDPSTSALLVTCSSPMTATIADEPVILSQAPSCPAPPLPPCDGKLVGHADHATALALSDCEDMFAELFYPGLPNLPLEQSSLGLTYQTDYIGFAQILGDRSSPLVKAVTQSIEHESEPQFSPSSLHFQQGRDLVDAVRQNTDASGSNLLLQQSGPVLQQLVHCQKQQLEDNAIRFVDLDHRLKVSQIQISELQQMNEGLQKEKELLHKENERLKSRLQEVAKSQVAAWTGIMIDIQQRD